MLINKVLTKASLAPTIAMENGGPTPEELSQLGVFVSEMEIRVISLPGYHQVFYKRPDISLIKVGLKRVKGSNKRVAGSCYSHSRVSRFDVFECSRTTTCIEFAVFATAFSSSTLPMLCGY
jgi:hypothetical protein